MVFAPRSGSRWCCFSLANNYHVPLRYRLRGVFSPSLLSSPEMRFLLSFSRVFIKREENVSFQTTLKTNILSSRQLLTRDISIARKTISISLSSLQQHATTEEKEREREHHRWSRFRGLFLHLIIECVFFVRVLFGPFLVVKKRPRVCGQYFSIPTVTYIENCDDDDGRTLFFLGRRDDDPDDAYQTAEKLRRRTV